MAQTDFFSGLVGGYGQQVLDQQRQARDKEDKDRGTEIQILEAAAGHPDLTDEARAAIWGRLGEIASGKKPGAKSKGEADPLHTAMGHLTGMTTPGGQQTPSGPTVAPVPPTNAPPIDSSMAGAPPVSLGTPPAPPVSGGTPTPPTSQAGTFGAPPQPPGGIIQFKTSAQKQKEAEQAAKDAVDTSVAARTQQVESYDQAWQDANEGKPVPPEVHKANWDWAMYGVHPTEKMKVDTSSTFQAPDGHWYHNVLNAHGDVDHTVPAMPKPLKFQQEIENKIQNYKAINSKKPDETDEQFNQRAELYVRKQQFDTDAKKLVALGLGNQAKQATIEHLTQLIKNGDIGRSARTANVLLTGARAQARARKNDMSDQQAQTTSFDTLVDEELQRVGTSRSEVSTAINAAQRGGAQRFTDRGITYNIPAKDVSDFLKDHPTAKRQ